MGKIPQFTIADIQLGVGNHEFYKGLELYKRGAVKNIKNDFFDYTATVSGTKDYLVAVNSSSYDRGDCNCYLGQKDQLCKHMIALAVAAVYKHRPNDTEIIKQPLDQAVCSGEIRDITKEEIENIKVDISRGVSLIKSYDGPSSKWFQYQDGLTKGSRLILMALSRLPVCEKSATICISLLKRLDKKLLTSGIDDSDGTVGDLMDQIVEVLNLFASLDDNLKKFIAKNLPKGEVFNWERGFGI